MNAANCSGISPRSGQRWRSSAAISSAASCDQPSLDPDGVAVLALHQVTQHGLAVSVLLVSGGFIVTRFPQLLVPLMARWERFSFLA
ncbi:MULTISPECIES: hypothetical protein [unclassified Bradyrhizobium]